jgi:hypothetical protein
VRRSSARARAAGWPSPGNRLRLLQGG